VRCIELEEQGGAIGAAFGWLGNEVEEGRLMVLGFCGRAPATGKLFEAEGGVGHPTSSTQRLFCGL